MYSRHTPPNGYAAPRPLLPSRGLTADTTARFDTAMTTAPMDWMMDQARDIALHNPYITSGHISRQFKIGEGRAHRVMETLEEEGLVIGGRYQRPTVRVR